MYSAANTLQDFNGPDLKRQYIVYEAEGEDSWKTAEFCKCINLTLTRN